MNSYKQHLIDAIEEIRSFAATDEGRKYDSKWYKQIEFLVEKVCTQTSNEEAERYLDMLMWCIVDSGPSGHGFAPSIGRAADAMQRKRKQAFKESRLTNDKNMV